MGLMMELSMRPQLAQRMELRMQATLAQRLELLQQIVLKTDMVAWELELVLKHRPRLYQERWADWSKRVDVVLPSLWRQDPWRLEIAERDLRSRQGQMLQVQLSPNRNRSPDLPSKWVEGLGWVTLCPPAGVAGAGPWW